MLLFHPQVSLK